MTILGIIHIRVDATFEDVMVGARLGGRIAGCSRQMNVEKSGDMAQIEEATITKLDGLRQ